MKTYFDRSAYRHFTRPRYHFDSIGPALLSALIVTTLDGWVGIFYAATDAYKLDHQPSENANVSTETSNSSGFDCLTADRRYPFIGDGICAKILSKRVEWEEGRVDTSHVDAMSRSFA